VLLDVLDEGVVLDELPLVSVDPLELGVVELLVESVPEAPMELVLPLVEPGDVLLLELVSLAVVEGTVVVVDELDAVDGVPSRFVQAPNEKAATMARAAHVVLDAFIRKLLEGLSKVGKGGVALGRHSRQPPGEPCRLSPLMCVGQTQRARLLCRNGRAAKSRRWRDSLQERPLPVPFSLPVLLVCFIAVSAALPRPPSSLPLSGVPASSGCMSVFGVFGLALPAPASVTGLPATGFCCEFMSCSLEDVEFRI